MGTQQRLSLSKAAALTVFTFGKGWTRKEVDAEMANAVAKIGMTAPFHGWNCLLCCGEQDVVGSCCNTSLRVETRFPCWCLAILTGLLEACLSHVRSKISFLCLSKPMKASHSFGLFGLAEMSLTCGRSQR